MWLLDYYERKALEYSQHQREKVGLPSIDRLEPGRRAQTNDCVLARTIAPGSCRVFAPLPALGEPPPKPYISVYGRRETLPWAVRRFIRHFDFGRYPHLEASDVRRYEREPDWSQLATLTDQCSAGSPADEPTTPAVAV